VFEQHTANKISIAQSSRVIYVTIVLKHTSAPLRTNVHLGQYYTVFHKTSASIIYYIFAKLWTIFIKIAEPSLQSMCILI